VRDLIAEREKTQAAKASDEGNTTKVKCQLAWDTEGNVSVQAGRAHRAVRPGREALL